MPSSLFARPTSQPKPDGNLIAQFAAFKRQMAGKDPEAMVRQMLADGRMTQAQFDSLKSRVNDFMAILR